MTKSSKNTVVLSEEKTADIPGTSIGVRTALSYYTGNGKRQPKAEVELFCNLPVRPEEALAEMQSLLAEMRSLLAAEHARIEEEVTKIVNRG